MICDIGDVVELEATFTDRKTGGTVDPNSVTCTVLSPDGTISTPSAEGENGIYLAEVEVDIDGVWRFAFDGTGVYQAATEGSFTVRERKVPR